MKKRFQAMLLAVAMCLAMAAPAFASDSDNDNWLKDWAWSLSIAPHGITVSKFLDNTNPETVVVPDTTSIIEDGAINDPNMTVISLPESIVSVGNDNGIENCKEIIFRGSKDIWFDHQGIYRPSEGGGRPRIGNSSDFPHRIPVKTLDGEIIDYVGPDDGTGTPSTHTHAWSTAWSNDASYHWHNCTATSPACDVTENSAKQGYGAHVYDDSQDATCNICGYTRTVESEHSPTALDHLPSNLDAVVVPQMVEQTEAWRWGKHSWALSESEEDIFQKIVAQTERLVKGKDSETQKARAIYDWVAKNVSYDYTALQYYEILKKQSHDALTEEQYDRLLHASDALCVFHFRRGICTGYANLANLMMTISGFPTAFISGISRDGGDHGWSAVYADGKWIVFDATWSEWDISPNFHDRVEEIRFIDGLFRGEINDAGEIDYRLLPGYQPGINCPADIIIPDSVTRIGNSAFYNCTGLTSVTIPDSVTSIGSHAFSDCTGLISVTIGNGVTDMGGSAFEYCTGLTSVTIGNGVTNIEAAAFYGCKSLTSVTIPDSVTSIRNGAFSNCTGLTSVTIPDSVTSIGSGAFNRTPWQESKGEFAIVNGILLCYQGSGGAVTIPNGVTRIGNSAFSNCTGLTSVTIGNGVTSIGDSAFFCCTDLTSVTIPDSVTSIEDRAFWACTDLTGVTIPNSVTSIGERTFYNCKSLTSVTIPDSVTSIGTEAFEICAGLKDVYYSGSEAQWKAISIEESNDPLTSATIHYNSAMPEQPTQPVTVTAQPTNDKLSVDGKDATPAAYKIGGANFFMLRDVAMLLNGTKAQFEISYDNDKKAINITTGKAYTPQGYELKTTPQPNATAETSSDAVYIDGNKVELTAYKIGGANFYGIRDLGRALGFNVDWTRERGMFIESDKPYSGT